MTTMWIVIGPQRQEYKHSVAHTREQAIALFYRTTYGPNLEKIWDTAVRAGYQVVECKIKKDQP